MKYYTKDFYILKQLINLCRSARKCDLAEKKDEKFYRKCYDRQCALFIRREKMSDCYIDPAKELQKYEEYVNAAGISDEERKKRIAYRNIYLTIDKERLESGIYYKFDKKLCQRKFAEKQRESIELCNRLPKEISDKIADVRVFALGYASGEVKKLLRPYCKEMSDYIERTALKASIETELAEDNISDSIGFNEFEEIEIFGLEEKNGDIYLKFEGLDLIVEDGKITEGQCKPVYPYNDKPDSPRSKIIASELHLEKGIYELSFLISDVNEIFQNDLWYLTIRGTDIYGEAPAKPIK